MKDKEKSMDSRKDLPRESLPNRKEKIANLDRNGQLRNGKDEYNLVDKKPIKEISQNGTNMETSDANPKYSVNTETNENSTVINPGSEIVNSGKRQNAGSLNKKNSKQNVNYQISLKTNKRIEISSSDRGNRKQANSRLSEYCGTHSKQSNFQKRRTLNNSAQKTESPSKSNNFYFNRVKDTPYSINSSNAKENGHLASNRNCVESGVREKNQSSHFKSKATSKNAEQTQSLHVEDSSLDSVKYREQNLPGKYKLKDENVKISETSVLRDEVVSITTSSDKVLKDAATNVNLCENVESSNQTNRKKGKKFVNFKDQSNQKLKVNSTNVKPNIAVDENQHNENPCLTMEEENTEGNDTFAYYNLQNSYYLPFWSVGTLPSHFEPQISGYGYAETPDQYYNSVPYHNYQNRFLNMNYDCNLHCQAERDPENDFAVYNTQLVNCVQQEPVLQPSYHPGKTCKLQYQDFYQKNYDCYIASLNRNSLGRFDSFTSNSMNSSYNLPVVEVLNGTHYYYYI